MTLLGLRRIWDVGLDLLYPPVCALCSKYGSFLCGTCAGSLPAADGRRCHVCWRPLPSDACLSCYRRPLRLNGVRSAYRYEGDVRRLVHALKFDGVSSLAAPLGQKLAETYRAHELDADVVVPVPLSSRRERVRGYNQAALLGKRVSASIARPFASPLRRRRHSPPQAQATSATARWANMAGAFAVPRPDAVCGVRVLLIDDVTTTGATLNACAEALLAAGAVSVTGLTLARED